MDPITAITAVNAALSLVEALIPQLSAWLKSGDITIEQQQSVLARYNALKQAVSEGFSGPEWERSTKQP